MFQLWRLVLLCGLLTGTSAFLLDNNVVTELQSTLRKELEIDDSAAECELTIKSISIGNITLQGTPGGQSINLSIPITAKVTLTLPLLGAVVDLTVSFVLHTSISFKIGENGALIVVIGECTYTPATISLPFVNSSVSSLTGLISDIKNTVTTLVNLVETYLVQYVLCPRIRTVISSLSGNLVQNVNDILQETTQQIVN
ncbi:short palate, lung and nasal epithelium carcinoma-associated protein 2B-like [Ovis canadensis]|uniref:short palate, lung and nasal epithelium carcinoma-associated protein 2B-like n=1 Tax=Ovis canadensis TaxID=37174 RepID=UPI0037504E95